MTLDYGNYGMLLIMDNAGSISSPVVLLVLLVNFQAVGFGVYGGSASFKITDFRVWCRI